MLMTKQELVRNLHQTPSCPLTCRRRSWGPKTSESSSNGILETHLECDCSWDNVYSTELANFEEIGDEGEIWCELTHRT